MKTSLPKLPTKQKEEIEIIVKELSKIKRVEKVILFGSFARGDFVLRDVTTENKTTRVYESDYDILVIVNHYKDDHDMLIDKAIKKIEKKYNIERSIDVILESMNHINKMLEENRYFFADIVKEGILLFDTKQHTLSQAKILTLEERKEIQKLDFKKWFESGERLFEGYETFHEKNYLNEAVFLLHQVAEKYITSYLLVKTGYRPKTHDIETLYKLMLKLDSRFENWFDLNNCDEKEKLELLRKAYVEARYDDSYKITKEELEFLEKKVLILRNLVEGLCKEEIYT